MSLFFLQTLNSMPKQSSKPMASSSKTPPLYFILTVISLFPHYFFYTHNTVTPQLPLNLENSPNSINVYISTLPRSLNYGLLQQYWSLTSDKRIGSDIDNKIRQTLSSISKSTLLPYPGNPVIKHHSAEYWMLGDLLADQELKRESFAKRVLDVQEADVVFVPFFASLSAELQLIVKKSVFRKKVHENEDYKRQKMVVDLVKKSEAWKRSGGRDHVFVLTGPIAMFHLKDEISPAVLLAVDFGSWHDLDVKTANESSTDTLIHHSRASLLKDVIVPHTHLLPRLDISDDNLIRHSLLYFRGAKHRHRAGLVREKLWDLLINEPGVIMEEGFPSVTGMEQSMKGMRTSEFCLHPAGDTPSSCRLYDAIQSLCIPVIVSDDIELPFEGLVDYSEFCVFVAVSDAMKPNWLITHLKTYSSQEKDRFRRKMAKVQEIFVYDNSYPGGIGPAPLNGAVNNIWKKVREKVPSIKDTIVRERRRPPSVSVPLRCHCT